MQIFRINEERDNDFTSPQLDSSIYKSVPTVDLPVIFSYFRGGYSEILNNYIIVAQSKNISVRFRYFYVQVSSPPKSVQDRKSTRLNSSHVAISYAVFCLKKK